MAVASTRLQLHVDLRQLDRLAKDLDPKVFDQFQRETSMTLGAALGFGAIRAKTYAPKATGRLAAGIRVIPPTVKTSGDQVVFHGKVTTQPDNGKAVTMEEGRGSGNPMPPVDAIEAWLALKIRRGKVNLVRRKGSSNATKAGVRFKRGRRKAELRRAAYFIARSIARKGQRPRKYMQRAESDAFRHLVTGMENLVDRYARKLES